MSNDTQQFEKQNPMRLWLERHLGKVILTSVPVVLTMLAGWIYTIGSEIAVIKEKIKEDDAQWSALLSTNEKLKDLEIELRVNNRLLSHFEQLLQKRLEDGMESGKAPASPKKYGSLPAMPVPETKPREERVEDYRQEMIQQMQKR